MEEDVKNASQDGLALMVPSSLSAVLGSLGIELVESRLYESHKADGKIDDPTYGLSRLLWDGWPRVSVFGVWGFLWMVVSQINEAVEQDNDARNINHLTRDMLNGAREAFMSLHTEHTVDKKLMPVDRLINMVPLYIYRKGSDEAKRFCKINKMAKISVDIEGVLFTRGRLLDSMNFKDTGELVEL